MTSSCSFRITRTAEGLAQAVTELSQRLIKLEKRLDSLETKSVQSQSEPPAKEIEMLDGVDELLRECKDLLKSPASAFGDEEIWSDDLEEQGGEIMAA